MMKKQQGTRGGEVLILLKSTSHNLKIIHPADVGPGRDFKLPMREPSNIADVGKVTSTPDNNSLIIEGNSLSEHTN